MAYLDREAEGRSKAITSFSTSAAIPGNIAFPIMMPNFDQDASHRLFEKPAQILSFAANPGEFDFTIIIVTRLLTGQKSVGKALNI